MKSPFLLSPKKSHRPVWKPSSKTLGGYRCIELRSAGGECELALAGRYGEIWQSSPDTYRAIITRGRIAKRYLPKEHWPILPTDETLVTFPAAHLPIWVERLKIPRTRPTQARYANSFGKNTPPDAVSGVQDAPISGDRGQVA